MKLIVGLGNPGGEYAATRHNAGFMAVDRLARDLGLTVKKRLARSLVAEGHIEGERIVLAKPQTYMNLSGEAVAGLLNWYKLTAGDLIIIYDDLDLPRGSLRIRPGGGSGGHRGLQSVIRAAGTDSFARVRLGIGRPDEPEETRETDRQGTAGYVLSSFAGEEAEAVAEAMERAAAAVRCILREGVAQAMNLYNRRKTED